MFNRGRQEARSTGFRASFLELLLNYTKIILFLRSHHFRKCSYLIFLYIIGYNIFHLDPSTHPFRNLDGRHPPTPKDGTSMPHSNRFDLWMLRLLVYSTVK